MSNGLTSVFFDVLSIAACDLAVAPWEKRLSYWLVQHDQLRTGLGCVGFDVEDLGWTHANFDTEKRFVTSVIDAALNQHGWERLPFSPNAPRVTEALARFREMVEPFTVSLIGLVSVRTWVPNDLPDGELCSAHGVYLHETGCIICHDAPEEP